jgi:hypothetical protein
LEEYKEISEALNKKKVKNVRVIFNSERELSK